MIFTRLGLVVEMTHFGRGNQIKYNKAITDNIPEIIKKSGNECNVKTLSDEEFLIELEKKLREEVEEYSENKSVKELADIIEVIERMSQLKGVPFDELERIRQKKAEERGRFNDNLFLISTSNPENS